MILKDKAIELFLRRYIQEYYKHTEIIVPDIKEREFGYGIYGRKIANRNLSFNSNSDLNNYLRNKVPFYFSYYL